MLKNYVLVITVGQTDLQVVTGEGESKERHEIEKKHIRAVHQWLLDNSNDYEIVPTPKRRGQDKINWNGQQPVIELGGVSKPLAPLKLCVAKLEKVLEDLNREGEPPRAILLLSTHRDSGNQIDAEPIAAAPLLAKWLATRFRQLRPKTRPVQPKADQIGWINYMEGKMTMSGDGPDYPFNRQGAELAVKALRKLSAIKEVDTLVLSDGGGLPELKPILRAAGLLYFRHTFRLVDPEDRKETDLMWGRVGVSRSLIDQTALYPPVDALLLSRHRAIILIEQGSFVEAWGIASGLQGVESEKSWVEKLGAVRNYFVGDSCKLSLLPEDIQNHFLFPGALRVALRVESALQSHRYNQAITLSITFYEQALRDFLELFFDQGSGLRWTNLSGGLTVKRNDHATEKWQILDKHFSDYDRHPLVMDNPQQFPKTLKIEPRFTIDDTYSTGQAWPLFFERQQIDMNCSLRSYFEKINGKYEYNNIQVDPKQVRNIESHGTTNEREFKAGLEAFRAKQLWAANFDSTGPEEAKYLEQPAAKNILIALGITDPFGIYRKLIREISSAIRTAPLL